MSSVICMETEREQMLTTLFDKLISWAHVPTAQAIRLSSFSACLGTCAYHSYKDFVYAHN